LLTLADPVNIAKNIANLKDVSHEISAATKPCSTAPGNKSGIVQAHRNLINKKAAAIMPKNIGMIAKSLALFILKILHICP
jgi:hypothetical protein